MAQHPPTSSPRSATGHIPVRTCVGCRKQGLRSELVRVVAQRGQVVVDEQRRLAGRGAWLHPDRDCLAAAIRRKALPRALRVSGELDAGGLEAYLDDRLVAVSEKTTDPEPRVLPSTGSRSTRHESAVKLKP